MNQQGQSILSGVGDDPLVGHSTNSSNLAPSTTVSQFLQSVSDSLLSDGGVGSLNYSNLMQQAAADDISQRDTLQQSHKVSVDPKNNSNNIHIPPAIPTLPKQQQQQHYNPSSADVSSVTAIRISDDSFKVEGTLHSVNIQQAVHIVSNPDLLKVWCSPISAFVLTNDHVNNNNNNNNNNNGSSSEVRREYDAEWVEGAAAFDFPNTKVLNAYRFITSVIFGQPTYGKVTLFIERGRAQVSITMKSYSEITYKITFQHSDQYFNRIKVINEVKILKTSCCVSAAPLTDYVLPSTSNHMGQAIASMDSLINLIQRGGDVHELSDNIILTNDDDRGTAPLLANF